MSDLLNEASLVLIPSGIKASKVYAQIPEDGSGDMTFARASTGTRINSQGLVEVVPYNLLQYSEQFDNAVWTKVRSSIVANSTTAPNGTNTADTITCNDTGASGCWITQTTSVSNERTSTIYIKPNTAFYFQIHRDFGVGVVFNLSNGTVKQSVSATGTIESVGNGWYKCTATFTGSGAVLFLLGNSSMTVSSWASTNGESAFIWGAQLNEGSVAKPYYATTDRLNIPRLNYQNGGGGCPSLLLEAQRTNVNENSNTFILGTTQTYDWYDFNGKTPVANQAISPEGYNNAWSLPQNSYLTTLYGKSIGLTTGDKITASIWAKGNETAFRLSIAASTDGAIYGEVYANLTTGAITSGSGTIESYGNGWYRITTTGTSSQNNGYPRIVIRNPNTSCFIYGSQFESGNYASSYIPTLTTSVTRVADSPTSSALGLTNATFAVNFKPIDYIVELFDFNKTGGGRMFYVAVASNGLITFNSVSGGSIGSIGSILTKGATCKLAWTLNASTSDLTIFINGVKIGTYTTNITTFGQFTSLQTFGYNPGTQIEQIAIFPSVLTDSQCIDLTS